MRFIININENTLPYSAEAILTRIASLLAGRANHELADRTNAWPSSGGDVAAWRDGMHIDYKRNASGSITFNVDAMDDDSFREYIGDNLFYAYQYEAFKHVADPDLLEENRRWREYILSHLDDGEQPSDDDWGQFAECIQVRVRP